jgi:hypothetical protein
VLKKKVKKRTYFHFFGSIGVELRASHLLISHSSTQAIPPAQELTSKETTEEEIDSPCH